MAVNHNPNPQVEATLPRLTEESLTEHFNHVFQHHNKREDPMWLQVHSMDFIETKQSGRPTGRNQNESPNRPRGGHTSTFHMTLSPAPANDQFDTEVFTEQGLRFALQLWHRHHQSDFLFDEYGYQYILRPGTAQSNPTVNPRYDQIHVYVPACNNRTSDTFGIIVGVPAMAVKHRRGFMDLALAIRECLYPHLPKKLQGDDFFDHIGCRGGTFSGDLKSKQRGQVQVIYLAASSRSNFEALLRSYNAFRASNRGMEMEWTDNTIQLLPMPKNQTTRTTTLEALKDVDQYFGACIKIKLRHINHEATDDEWAQLKDMEEFVALFPEFCNEDPSPQAYTLYLRRTPDTHHLNGTTIRQHNGFPTNILLPSLAAIAATPPSPESTTQQQGNSTPSSHTSRLLEFTDRLLRRKPTNRGKTNRASPPGTPPPTKRAAPNHDSSDHSEKSDPYDDGTDWQTVIAKSPQLQNPTHPDDGKPKAKKRANQYDDLADELSDDDNVESNHNQSRNSNDEDEEMADADEWDNHSHSLLTPEDDHHNGQSAPTGDEIAMIFSYVRENNPSRLPEIRRYLENTRSFATDTDAQDAWEYAQSLVETGPPTIAGTRTGHVVPHDTWAKEPNE